mmetsp:Transcript_31990/g.101718  ORF Transcript_31990/g.101718 Transcript_31990/m.101718 type:complete len:706 (-) Transcript_31990:188-2305(-)
MVPIANPSSIVDSCLVSACGDTSDNVRPSVARETTAAFHSPRSTRAASDSCGLCSDDEGFSLPSVHEDDSLPRGSPCALGEKFSATRIRLVSGHSSRHSTSLGSSTVSSVDSASSDSEMGDDEHSDAMSAFLVYPIAMLLGLRAAAVRQMPCRPSKQGCRPCSFLGYTVAEIPNDIPCSSPSASPSSSSSPASWSPHRQSCQVAAGDDKIIRAARSILNKLTIEKFESLYEQLVTIGIQSVSHIKCLMNEVFEKATVQHHFIPMYADLCVRLESDARIMPAMASDGRPDCFKICLLNRCQEAFESLLKSGSSSCDGCDDDEAMHLRKQRALGNVKFVGQLLIRGMLSSRLLLQCAQELLRARGQCAEALESLAALLTVAAPAFDTPDWSQHTQLNAIFRELADLTKDKSVVTRERFLLRDVLEARAAGWPARTCAAKPSSPMRLEEVRVAADLEASPATATPSWKRDRRPPDKWTKNSAASPALAPHQRSQTDGMSSAAREAGSKAAARLATAMASTSESPKQRPARDVATKPAAPIATQAMLPAQTALSQSLPAAQAANSTTVGSFDPKAFRKVLTATMRELAQGCSVPTAVQRIRSQCVPKERQCAEFADILTRACEESRGPVRRCAFAFVAGLCAAAGDSSAFERAQCTAGLAAFFRDVFEDLQEEVPRLPSIIEAELLPTLRSVLPLAELREVTPARLWKL